MSSSSASEGAKKTSKPKLTPAAQHAVDELTDVKNALLTVQGTVGKYVSKVDGVIDKIKGGGGAADASEEKSGE